MDILCEYSDLCRGVFWIPDVNDIYKSNLYFQIPCDSNGNIDSEFTISSDMASKNTDNYNHKNLWSTLSKNYTNGKPFDYYPRGRIEINRGIATVYYSPHIPQEELKSWVIDRFNLTTHNGIKKIKMIADGSNHYHCFLDD